jgi:hypothetical protein
LCDLGYQPSSSSSNPGDIAPFIVEGSVAA